MDSHLELCSPELFHWLLLLVDECREISHPVTAVSCKREAFDRTACENRTRLQIIEIGASKANISSIIMGSPTG